MLVPTLLPLGEIQSARLQGNTIISRLTPEFLDSVKVKGEYVKSTLTGKPGIIDVSGMGLMLGIETTVDAKAVIAKCLEKGVVCIIC